MKKTYYFIAGLPRSGSTVLSAILNQNPNFYSGPSSPIIGLMNGIEGLLQSNELFTAFPKINEGKLIISSCIDNFYSDIGQPIVFDKNRAWTSHINYIEGYFNIQPKIICPVRNMDEILASFISMHKRNPYEVNGRINFIDEMLIKADIPLTDDNRCRYLVSDQGIIGQSYNSIKQCLVEGKQKYLHFVEYEDLMSNPESTLNKIYDFLEEEKYEHDYNNLVNINRENDSLTYGFEDMHKVRPRLGKTSEPPENILSQLVLERCKGSEFWKEL